MNSNDLSKPDNSALMFCPACGSQVSKSAISCPNCGHPFRKERVQIPKPVIVPQKSGLGFWGVVFAIIVAVVLIGIFG